MPIKPCPKTHLQQMPSFSCSPRRRLPMLLTRITSSFLFGLFVQFTLRPLPLFNRVSRAPVQQLCRLSTVSFRPSSPTGFIRAPSLSLSADPSHWHVTVISPRLPHAHTLTLPHNARPPHLLPHERNLLLRVAPCTSPDSCNATANCTYSPEDPSDAFWLRSYAQSSKFVVLFNIGIATLIFFIAAILADGSIFHPHRPGLADASASTLIMLALASLLYILVVPHRYQFALHGRGTFDTIAFVFVVVLIAVLLPALAVVWLSSTIFVLFLAGFLIEHIVFFVGATIHFIGVLLLYQAQNTFLHVRLVYLSHPDEDDTARNDEHLLTMGARFLSRVRSNWLINRVPQQLEERALQVVQNHMPDHISEQLMREYVPHISFDDLNSESGSTIPSAAPPSPPEPQPVVSADIDTSSRRPDSTEATPLLQAETASVP